MSAVTPDGQRAELARLGRGALTRVELIYAAGDPDRLQTLQWLHLRESDKWTFGLIAAGARVHKATVMRRLRRARSDLRKIWIDEEGKRCADEDGLNRCA